MSGQSATSQTISERLARRLAEPVDDAARKRAVLHLLDWTGCAVAGAAESAAAAMRRALKDGGEGALYYGALGNILEMDDVDKRALLHPGPVVAPAALTLAEGASGAELLDALVRGYEAMIRLGRAVGAAHYRYWHNTGTCGAVGAAAAVASLMRLGIEETATAIELGAAQASGFWQARHEPRSFAKQLHTARAADAGVLAAQLAASGFIGVRTIFEGPQGFFAATCGNADPQAIVDDIDGRWRIDQVSFKPWPACRHAHAAIDAALLLRADGTEADTVRALTVRTYRDAIIFCDKPTPRTVIEAKFSLQHAVAIALSSGPPTLADFSPERIGDESMADLRSRIVVVEDEEFTARYPARFGAAVDVALENGATRSIAVPDALGDPENPADSKLILSKAKMLMVEGGLAENAAQQLIGATLALAEGGMVDDYRALLRSAVRA
jgi:2-methylcitrate dehydratase PrpD